MVGRRAAPKALGGCRHILRIIRSTLSPVFLRSLGRSRRRTFRSDFRRGGLFSACLRGRRFFFGRLFVRIASIVCDVKAGPFEYETGPGAKQALYLSMSPLRQPAEILWALAKRFVAH